MPGVSASVRPVRTHLKLTGFLLAWWVAVAFFYTEGALSMARRTGEPLGWAPVLGANLAGCLLWIPLSLGLIQLVRFFPWRGERWLASLLAFSAGVGIVILVRALFVYALDPVTHWWYPQPPPLHRVLSDSLRNNLILGWLIVGVAHAFHYFEQERTGRLQIAELEGRLSRAQLDALSAQLNPHFLFNALNSIAELTHHDANKADHMLLGLSALLRRSLKSNGQQEVLLSEELELLTHYLSIEKVRMGERLASELQVGDDCLGCYVPILLLQPLAENSIVHGLASRACAGVIRINIDRSAQRLRIVVADNGAAESRPSNGHGIGLRNVEERMRCLYGAEFAMDVRHEQLGTTVRIEIPARTTPALASAAHADTGAYA